MRIKELLEKTSTTIILMGFIVLLAFLFYFVLTDSVQGSPASLIDGLISTTNKKPSGLPVRLIIPNIKVNAVIKYVGITSTGAMDVPKSPSDVVWFNLGPRPGEKGSAVIAGHYGWKNGRAAAFDNLYKLRKDDKIYIKNDKGEIISFVVREIKSYSSQADASNIFSSTDGKAHLNLITCQGVYDKVSKNYSKRLVIFTDKE